MMRVKLGKLIFKWVMFLAAFLGNVQQRIGFRVYKMPPYCIFPVMDSERDDFCVYMNRIMSLLCDVIASKYLGRRHDTYQGIIN